MNKVACVQTAPALDHMMANWPPRGEEFSCQPCCGKTHSCSNRTNRSMTDRPLEIKWCKREAQMTFRVIRNKATGSAGSWLQHSPLALAATIPSEAHSEKGTQTTQASGPCWTLVLSCRIQHKPNKAQHMLALLVSVLIAKRVEKKDRSTTRNKCLGSLFSKA